MQILDDEQINYPELPAEKPYMPDVDSDLDDEEEEEEEEGPLD